MEYSSGSFLIYHIFQVCKAGCGGRPSGVKGDVRDRGYDLLLRQSVLESLLEMELDLFDTIQRNQAGNRDQSFIAQRERRTFPNVSEKNVLRQLSIVRC